MKLFLINFEIDNENKISVSKMQKFYSKICLEYILKNIFNQDLILKKEENGKPYFENSDLKISISHSKNLIAFLFSEDKIGVDVENTRNRNYFNILKYFKIDDTSISLEEFYQIWTIYEAEFKSQIKNGKTLTFKYKNNICSVSFEKENPIETFEIKVKDEKIISLKEIKIEKENFYPKISHKINL